MKKTLVEVIWRDATSTEHNREFMDEVKKNNLMKELIIKQSTYGRLYYKDKKVVVIVNTEDNDRIEYTAIPGTWIEKIIYYRK